MSEEVLNCARFGDDEELKTILDSVDNDARDALLNFVQPETLNTPLHMGGWASIVSSYFGFVKLTYVFLGFIAAACANGHVDCVRELLKHGARHLPNANGNLPLRTEKMRVGG